MTPPNITKDNIVTVGDNPFIRLFDIQYAPGKHYFDASRRPKEDLVALKDEKEGKEMLPDAVSCFVIIETSNDHHKAQCYTKVFLYCILVPCSPVL